MSKDIRGRNIECGWLSFPGALVAILASPIVIFALTVGFYEARKAYWDQKVKEMCARDGGVTVYETVQLTKKDYETLGGTQGGLSLPDERRANKDYPYFRRVVDTVIWRGHLEVVRGETVVIRNSDGKALGRAVQYWRRGGDFPTGLFHDSSFVCPEQIRLSAMIFKLEVPK